MDKKFFLKLKNCDDSFEKSFEHNTSIFLSEIFSLIVFIINFTLSTLPEKKSLVLCSIIPNTILDLLKISTSKKIECVTKYAFHYWCLYFRRV